MSLFLFSTMPLIWWEEFPYPLTPLMSMELWTSVSTLLFIPPFYPYVSPLLISSVLDLWFNFLHYILPPDNQRVNLTYLCMVSISHGDITTNLSHSNQPPCKQNSKWTPSSGQIKWESCRGQVLHISQLGPYNITNWGPIASFTCMCLVISLFATGPLTILGPFTVLIP